MIKTLIVDDDYLVRMYLMALTNWEKEGFHIVDHVQDGEQALEKIEALKPELIITDISMPVMDGIELIKEIKKRDIPCKIIVLSCHDDFNYVKEALKHGADDYILKNAFNKKNIDNILDNFRQKVDEGREEAKQKEKLLQLADLGSNELKKKFLNHAIQHEYDYNQLVQKSLSSGINLSLLKTAVIEIQIDKSLDKSYKFDHKNHVIIFNGLMDLCQNMMRNKHRYEMIAMKDYHYTLIIDGGTITEHGLLHHLATDIYKYIEKEYRLTSLIGISDTCIGKESLKHAYNHAKQALDRSFYNNGDIFIHELRHFTHTKKISFNRFYDDIKKSLMTVDIESITQRSREQIDYFEKEYVQPTFVLNWLREMDKLLQIKRDQQAYDHITSIYQVRKMIENYREQIECYPNISTKITNMTVAQTIEYINNHFDKTISLTSVAETLKVNSTYLSRLFKQETKMNFTDYLATCRIENAKSLLTGTNEKIKDIAVKCGFYDYRYFCKTFKKMVGESPLSYRKDMIID